MTIEKPISPTSEPSRPPAADFPAPSMDEQMSLAPNPVDESKLNGFRRFEQELVVGGAVSEDVEPASGLGGVLGMLAIGALLVWLAMVNVWYALFAVAVLFAIFLHELGHYMTARWTGMKVSQFFIGFGPRLWSIRRGETEYGVRVLPLGAFVRIIGMTRFEEVPAIDESRTYRVKSYPRRLLVISAGSIMHALLAIAVLFGVYATVGEPATAPGAQVVEPSERGGDSVTGAAKAAGIQPGDAILAVGDAKIESAGDLGPAVQANEPGTTINFQVVRGGPTVDRGGTLIEIPVTLGSSFSPDDRVVAIEAIEVDGQASIDDALAKFDDGDVVGVGLAADGPDPKYVPGVVSVAADGTRQLMPTSLAGVTTSENGYNQKHSILGAATNAVTDLVPISAEMAKGAVAVFNPSNVWSHLNGTNDDLATRPTTLVGVGSVSADVGTELGFAGFMYLFAMLNLFFGLFNMVPLLPLDGGHAAIATYERIRELLRGGKQRYYADINRLVPLTIAVVMLLGFMMVSGLYLDITRPL